MNYIQIERRPDDIAIITINRPEVLNAINVDVIAELSSVIDILSADDSVKVVRAKDHFVQERISDM
ncbi:MAG: hypothetical protein WCC17_10245 [Candidatus Nitrosopolaris sp.]